MSIRLRIAGIYYDESFKMEELVAAPAITLPGRDAPGAGPTIFELLETAVAKPGENKSDFVYVFERRGKALSITSLGVRHDKEFGPTLGRNTRRNGIYQLTEIAIPEGVVAWQYYVYRGGKSESQQQPPTPPTTGFSPAKGNGRGFTGFDQFVLRDGDEVIWRQVAILRGPNVPDRPYGQ
jgi:hypothetical protein